MSNLGHFEFVTSASLQLVNSYEEACPINGELTECEIEVTCNIHIDDPEDGPYGDDIEATISGTDIELGDGAIELLELSRLAGEIFWESEPTRPKDGEKYVRPDGSVWKVVGSGRHNETTEVYTLLKRESKKSSLYGYNHPPYMIVNTQVFHQYEYSEKDKELVKSYRLMVEDEPKEDEFRIAGAVYQKPALGD